MKTVAFTPAARKSFKRLAAAVQDRISAKLVRYAESGAGDVTGMQGEVGARMRVDDYRVIFTETETAIEVRAVGHRREIYR